MARARLIHRENLSVDSSHVPSLMQFRSLRLQNFRAHAKTSVEFTPGVNLIHGPNGVGKTNMLEAIHYLALSKSFITSTDMYAVRDGNPHFEVEGEIESDRRGRKRLKIIVGRAVPKRAFVNGAPLDRLSELVGIAPIVVYSPEDHVLTSGPPEERRRFLNNIMSQARPAFMDDLGKYRRLLRQRNELLGRLRAGRAAGAVESTLLAWTQEFVTVAARIVHARSVFTTDFQAYLQSAYELLGEQLERPTITYRPFDDVSSLDTNEVAQRLVTRLERSQDAELESGRTAAGPHRDELDFRLNDYHVRRYGSQGQHRSFGMALKIAQYLYLADRVDEQPVLLLDDVFGNLDPRRTEIVLRLLVSDSIGQTFITATSAEPFGGVVPFSASDHQQIEVSRQTPGDQVMLSCGSP